MSDETTKLTEQIEQNPSGEANANASLNEESKSQSAEEIADLITKQQQQSLVKSGENVIVSNFLGFFEPLVKNLDANVEALRTSQCELTNQIKSLLNQISVIYEDEKKKLDLDEYTKKLVMSKKRLNTVQATVIAVQERLNRMYVNIQKDPYLKMHREQQQQQQNQPKQQE